MEKIKMLENENYASELVWELIKDDLDNLPKKKKLSHKIQEELSLLEFTEDEDILDTIKSYQDTIVCIQSLDEENLETELYSIINTFQKRLEIEPSPW